MRIASAALSGIEWATGIEFDIERAELDAAAEGRRVWIGIFGAPGSPRRRASARPAAKRVM